MFVYWIKHKNHKDIKTEGYVGISINPEKRFKNHISYDANKHLRNALIKYKDDITIQIVIEEEKDFCLLLEEELRPNDNIGWNIVKGGGLPPNIKGMKTPRKKKPIRQPLKQSTKEKISKSLKAKGFKGKKRGPLNKPRKPYTKSRKGIGGRKKKYAIYSG